MTGWAPRLDLRGDESLRAAANACTDLVAAMERGDEPHWLTLTGVNGCGKTMLMKQVFEQAVRVNPGNPVLNPIWPPNWETSKRKIYEGGRPYCLWIDERRLSARLRGGEYRLIDSFRSDFFVAMDEVGVERDPTNFISNALGEFCEARLGHWGMFATNLTLQEIAERMDARIASRLIRDRNRVVSITAGDYALRKR